MIEFRTINPDHDMETCIEFREDSFRASFPHAEEWKQYWHPEDYRIWLQHFIEEFPIGALHIWGGDEIIGQLEFKRIDENGHVYLYYLRPDMRGKGFGEIAHRHVVATLIAQGCKTATLRVGPDNARAIGFYKKLGWVDLGQDQDHSHVRKYLYYL